MTTFIYFQCTPLIQKAYSLRSSNSIAALSISYSHHHQTTILFAVPVCLRFNQGSTGCVRLVLCVCWAGNPHGNILSAMINGQSKQTDTLPTPLTCSQATAMLFATCSQTKREECLRIFPLHFLLAFPGTLYLSKGPVTRNFPRFP